MLNPQKVFLKLLMALLEPSQITKMELFVKKLNSITLKAFVMHVTFLLFHRNLYVVLARAKYPKNSIHRS